MALLRRTTPVLAATLALLLLIQPIRVHADYVASATPGASCGAGDHPELTQGRTPLADFRDGRSNLGYTCNTQLVSQFGTTGGYRVWRYVDPAGHVCAYYDTTLLFPTNLISDSHRTGVFVVDMTDPAKPVMTADLVTLAMSSPHESLSLNAQRGLLAADLGNPATYPGWVDIYSLKQDCRHPVLDASLPIGILGHEGAFSPDGNTFWVTSVIGNLTALDVSDPRVPRILYSTQSVRPHGLNISDDGKTLYIADLGSSPEGLTVFDVSQVQRRVPNPQVKQIAHLSWPNVSIPQVPIPITVNGRPYLIEIDEFSRGTGASRSYDPNAEVGAARVIDIANPQRPRVVSDLRLAVQQASARSGPQRGDPGAASALQGYAGHYCYVPQRANPGVVACSMIMSGLRVFDIRDPRSPREIAYFNMPPPTKNGAPNSNRSYQSSYAMSQPAFDSQRGQIWYSDGNSGLWVVQLTHGVWPFTG